MPDDDARGLDATRESSISRRVLTALLTPLLLVVVSGVVVAVQLQRMSADVAWVDHSDRVIAKTYEVLKFVVDQETALRGYLLADDRAFLEPFLRSDPDARLRELAMLVQDNPQESARVVRCRALYAAWREIAAPAAVPGGAREAVSLPALQARKTQMDAFRLAIAELLQSENLLHRQRLAAAAASTRQTNYLLLALGVALAAAIGLLSRRQLGEIARTYRHAIDLERETTAALAHEAWLRAGHASVAEGLAGNLSLDEVARGALATLARYVGADVGAFYVREPARWRRLAGYALDVGSAGPEIVGLGEGLIGEAGRGTEVVWMKDVPSGYFKVRSGLGESSPVHLLLVPAPADGQAHGVIELGFLHAIDERVVRLAERVGNAVALAITSAQYRARLADLLEEAQRQTEELQVQQEELRVANEELSSHRDALQLAQARLEDRSEKLEASNAALLVERTAVAAVQRTVEQKAAEAERASAYKSEFLANMSHELRTPLNSALILSKLLADNKDENLTEEQVRYATTIHNAGNDLLTLINDVLDLAKVESGKMAVHPELTTVASIAAAVSREAEPVAQQKGIAFSVQVQDAPADLVTDRQRVTQILRNLLANAVKFTDRGEVVLTVRSAENGGVAFLVRDTGIGIDASAHDAIFEAFRQADGTTQRRFGGTGLGLSISRELAALLGGTLRVESTLGEGSTFTLTLPRSPPAPGETVAAVSRPASRGHDEQPLPTPVRGRSRSPLPAALIPDDRAQVDRGRKILLIVEDELPFAQIVRDLARELDFQCLVATTASEGVRLAHEHSPSAVILDVRLPDHSGLSVLDRLKRDPTTRHIPVHVVSAADEMRAALDMGAIGYLSKPVSRDDLLGVFQKLERQFSRRVRRVLVVEDDAVQRRAVEKLLSADDVETVGVPSVGATIEALAGSTFDCVVTDLSLGERTGYDLLETMAQDGTHAFPPVIVYTGRSLTPEEEHRLRRYSASIIVKGARSPERLLDEVTLFLHQVESELPLERQRMLRRVRDRDAIFDGRRILIAEDDVRNIFALSSLLEQRGAEVVIARNGREAIEQLEKVPNIDLVLMDIMMPDMDGLTAMREIRRRGAWPRLKIVALTAKAMKDDQERCLAAGANDYVAKPLDVEMLLSLLRVWMPR